MAWRHAAGAEQGMLVYAGAAASAMKSAYQRLSGGTSDQRAEIGRMLFTPSEARKALSSVDSRPAPNPLFQGYRANVIRGTSGVSGLIGGGLAPNRSTD